MLNSDSKGQNIEDIVENLTRIEIQKRQQRVSGFIRLFGESVPLSPDSPQYQLKNANKINIQRIRQFSYNETLDQIKIKEFPCYCSSCLTGAFEQCHFFNQKIIYVDIENRRLREKNDDELESEPATDPISNQELNETREMIPNTSIDVEYLHKEYSEEFQPKQSPTETKKTNASFDSQPCSSPDRVNQTSSQKKDDIPDLLDLGPLDVSLNDFDFVQHRINNMVFQECLKPTKYMMDKKSLEELLNRKGLLDGCTLNYIGNMYLSQNNSNNCYVIDPQLANFLRTPARARREWTRCLTTHDPKRFEEAEKLIIPWHQDRNHWTCYYLNSTNQTIQYFDSYREPPRLTDLKQIIKFIRVS